MSEEKKNPYLGAGAGPCHNREILVVGYGSLLSGYGLLAERRGGASRLVARDAAPISIRNARRGLAKPSSHGRYLAMDIEPVDRSLPIAASTAADIHGGGIGGLLLTFDRESAPTIARREDYDAYAFERLIGLAERAGKPLGEYLMKIASATNFDLLTYRMALRSMLDYTSRGYIFHPIEIDDGRIAIIAIGSGFEGSGDRRIVSRRQEFGVDRLPSREGSRAARRRGAGAVYRGDPARRGALRRAVFVLSAAPAEPDGNPGAGWRCIVTGTSRWHRKRIFQFM